MIYLFPYRFILFDPPLLLSTTYTVLFSFVFFLCVHLLASSLFFSPLDQFFSFSYSLFLICCRHASCFPLSSSPPSCLISRDWTSQVSSQMWSHLRSVLAGVSWSAATTWPSVCRAALVRRETASSQTYVITSLPQSSFSLCSAFMTQNPSHLLSNLHNMPHNFSQSNRRLNTYRKNKEVKRK